MQELIEKLQKEHGLQPAQSHGILNTIKEFIKEKFPMVESAMDNLFPTESHEGNTPSGDTGTTEGPAQKGGSFLDTESDTPGETGEKEKQAAKDKLDNMVSPDKKNQ